MAYTGTLENSPGPGEDSAETPEAPDSGSDSKEMEKVTGFISLDAFPEKPSIGKVCSFRVIDVNENGEAEIEYVDHKEEPKDRGMRPPPWEGASENEADQMLNT